MYATNKSPHPLPTKAERLFDSVFGGKKNEEDDRPRALKQAFEELIKKGVT